MHPPGWELFVDDPIGVLILVAVAIGLVLMTLALRRRRRADPEEAAQAAALKAERDQLKTSAIEAADRNNLGPNRR